MAAHSRPRPRWAPQGPEQRNIIYFSSTRWAAKRAPSDAGAHQRWKARKRGIGESNKNGVGCQGDARDDGAAEPGSAVLANQEPAAPPQTTFQSSQVRQFACVADYLPNPQPWMDYGKSGGKPMGAVCILG